MRVFCCINSPRTKMRGALPFLAAHIQKKSRSVSRVLSFNTAIYLDLTLPPSSSDSNKRSAQARFTRSHLASGGVYIARLVTKAAVSSYLAFSPLRRLRDAVLSVALSLKSPSPAVNRHPACVKLGLSSSYFRTPQPYNLLYNYCTLSGFICQLFSG